MPIYEYICRECGNEVEVIQRFSDPPLKQCRVCSGPLEKKISQSTFRLKGTGWYLTDYAHKSSGPESNHSEKQNSTKVDENVKSPPAKDSKPAESKAESNTGGT